MLRCQLITSSSIHFSCPKSIEKKNQPGGKLPAEGLPSLPTTVHPPCCQTAVTTSQASQTCGQARYRRDRAAAGTPTQTVVPTQPHRSLQTDQTSPGICAVYWGDSQPVVSKEITPNNSRELSINSKYSTRILQVNKNYSKFCRKYSKGQMSVERMRMKPEQD